MDGCLRVLIVEDNPGDADLIEALLEEAAFGRFETRCVARLAEAVALLAGAPPPPCDVVLLDLGLPDSSGLDTVRSLRRAAPELPIVVLTGDDDVERGLAAVKEGAQDYLVKGQAPAPLLPRFLQHAVERQRLQLALCEAERQHRTILDSQPGIVLLMDAAETVAWANRTACEAFCLAREQLVGRACRQLWAGCVTSCEDCPVRAAPHRGALPAVLRGTGDGRTWRLSAQRTQHERPRAAGIVVVGEDVTATLAAEAELRRSQRLEAVGRLAGGIAHEFNNMLGIIGGYSELLLERTGGEETLAGPLGEIAEAARRSAELVGSLLAFARAQDTRPEPLVLNRRVTASETLLRRLLGEDVDLQLDLDDRLWPVCIDPAQLDQLIANLVLYARESVAEAGRVAITTRNVTVDTDGASRLGCEPGEYATLSVRDSGAGLDEQAREHLFDPFYSAREGEPVGGLGLATVYGIVRQSLGAVEVVSGPGAAGTTICVYLPRHRGAAAGARKEPVAHPARALDAADGGDGAPGGDTVLVVDDERAIAKLCEAMLGQLGYRSLTAATPAEALALAERRPGAIDLLLADVVMTGMNGRELRDALRRSQPDLRTVFMSGHTAGAVSRRGVTAEGDRLLDKPFTKEALGRALRAASAAR